MLEIRVTGGFNPPPYFLRSLRKLLASGELRSEVDPDGNRVVRLGDIEVVLDRLLAEGS